MHCICSVMHCIYLD